MKPKGLAAIACQESIEELLERYSKVKIPTPAMMADPVWRLCSGVLYKIRSEDAEPIPFFPTPAQLKVIEAIYIKGWKTIVIPKARQVRMSTVLALICLDWVLFTTSAQISLADIDIPAAQRKLEEKLMYAYERLPEAFKRLWIVKKKASPGTLTVQHLRNKANDPNARSVFYAGQRARGGTNQLLWMSEWAELAAKRPAESSEHLRGAWPAAARGVRIIESTWYGGQSGDVWGIAKKGLDEVTKLPLADDKCSELTPRILFFPWYVIPERRLACKPEQIKKETRDYFADIEKQTGDKLDDEQMYWYQEEMAQYGYDGRYIYPSIIHECWDARIEGAVWGDALSYARTEGRITEVPYNPEYEVDTFWDLGAPENQPCLYVQHIFGQRNYIDCDAELKGAEGLLSARITRMKEKGYTYGTHYLPHDAAARQKNGISFGEEFQAELTAQGVSGRVVILKVTPNANLRRTHFEGMLRTCVYVDEEKCKPLLESWQAYRYKPDPSREGRFLDEVVSDWACHISDATGYLSEAILAGHVPHSSNGIMANLYFDAPYLSDLMRSLPEHRYGTWAIEFQGNRDFGRITARRDDTGGWLRIWEDPVPGRSYIVAMTAGAVVVWRASLWDAATGKELPATLAAACVDEQGIHSSNLYKWAAMASQHYGDAPITADITALPGAVEALRSIGAVVMARRQSLSDRRVGQQSQELRKPGHDFGVPERIEAYAIMQALMRDQQAAIYCPVTLRQMQSIIIGETGTPDLLDGAKEHWVKACALALWNIGQAGVMRRPTVSSGPVDYAGAQARQAGRRKLA